MNATGVRSFGIMLFAILEFFIILKVPLLKQHIIKAIFLLRLFFPTNPHSPSRPDNKYRCSSNERSENKRPRQCEDKRCSATTLLMMTFFFALNLNHFFLSLSMSLCLSCCVSVSVSSIQKASDVSHLEFCKTLPCFPQNS